MPIIVLDNKRQERFVLVGVAHDKAAVTDSEGAIQWVPIGQLTVIDVDGTPPIELLAERRKGSGTREIVEDLLDETGD